MLKQLPKFIGLFIFVIILSCSSNNQQKISTDSIAKNKKDTLEIVDGGIPIFYNMYLSVELSSLFKSIGASYNSEILNSPDKAKTYEISTDKALNLGIYAVDLSYAKYFDQFKPAGNYLVNMQKLSADLGIPSDRFSISLKRIENNLTNKDSLVKIANEIYKTTEDFLRQNERGSAASLIIAGGWTEAMYIATSLVKKNASDQELIERIQEQKNSVNNLISLLTEFQNENVIKDLIDKLSKIKTSLEDLNSANNEKQLYLHLSELTTKIKSLRQEMVD